MFLSKEIADLKEQLSNSHLLIAKTATERDTALAATGAHEAAIAALTAERDQAAADLVTTKASLAASIAEIATLKASVDSKVRETIASAGVPAIKRDVDKAGDVAADATGAGRTKATWGREF